MGRKKKYMGKGRHHSRQSPYHVKGGMKKVTEKSFLDYLIEGNNNPPDGKIEFNADYCFCYWKELCVRVNHGCYSVVIENNSHGGGGYTVAVQRLYDYGFSIGSRDKSIDELMFRLQYPNVNEQMDPTPMKIISVEDNTIWLSAMSFEHYLLKGERELIIFLNDGAISLIRRNIYNKEIGFVYYNIKSSE